MEDFLKTLIATLCLVFSFQSFAKDMSATEVWDDVYVDKDMGYLYRGGCSLHEHYLNEKYKLNQTIVKYFEPYSSPKLEFTEKMKDVDSNLLATIANEFGEDYLKNADDLEIHSVQSFLNPHYSLTRLNIGVGGGNGIYLFYLKTNNNQPLYLKVAQTVDGDVNFCDELVWMK